MTNPTLLSTSAEDYLEAILRLVADKGAARVRDIAAALSVHKSTVSATLKSLAEKGLVNYAPYEIATLTERGRRIARDVSGRHEVLRRFLGEVLGVSEAAAETNACRMEHILDSEVLDRLAKLVDFAEQGRRKRGDWTHEFQLYINQQ
jgi:DtxR family transcriptional regulator, Mn-dependent transcriptional regulator